MVKLCVLTKMNKETSNWLTDFIFCVMVSYCGALLPSAGVDEKCVVTPVKKTQHRHSHGYEKTVRLNARITPP